MVVKFIVVWLFTWQPSSLAVGLLLQGRPI